MTSLLPPGFADLERFAPEWCLKGQPARMKKMVSTDFAALTDFYQVMLPRLDAVVEHLNAFPLDDMPPAQQRLMDLALTFAETAHPVDLKWAGAEQPGVLPLERMHFSGASLAW